MVNLAPCNLDLCVAVFLANLCCHVNLILAVIAVSHCILVCTLSFLPLQGRGEGGGGRGEGGGGRGEGGGGRGEGGGGEFHVVLPKSVLQ